MFEQAFNNIDDILCKEDGCTIEPDYTGGISQLLGAGHGCQSAVEGQELRLQARLTDSLCVTA